MRPGRVIEIYVASYNGRPLADAPKGRFGPEGGTLGRGADNQLVLPVRYISRVQARIRYNGTRFLIANVSAANPLFLNETVVESGSESVLDAGDELRIGLYVLGVRIPEAEAAGTPVAVSASERPIGVSIDAITGPGGAAVEASPLADLRPSAPSPARKIPPGGQSGASPPPARLDRIPDDFDPFAMPSSTPRNTDHPPRDLAAAAPRSVPGAGATPAAHAPGPGRVAQADVDAMLEAFLKGTRMTEMTTRVRLTPGLMELMGALVYHATAGAMELIAARQITKREIGAEVTMIVARENNPLKFLPTPEAAIMQMLGPKMPGFMKGSDAMRDAFDDLRAHEVAVIAGMRAALAEVLRRFDPTLLQKRLGGSGALDTFVPAARRARLWEMFEARFQEIYREANDDFRSVFGEAFIKAYEEQIELDRAHRRKS